MFDRNDTWLMRIKENSCYFTFVEEFRLIHSGPMQVFLMFLYEKQISLKLLIESLVLNALISFGIVMTQHILGKDRVK